MKSAIILLASLVAAGPTLAETVRIDADGAVEMALGASEAMARARNAAEQARMQQHVARTAYLPKFAGSVTTGWSLPDTEYPEMGISLRMRGLYMAGINLTQPIFAGGKILAANKLAGIGRQAADRQLELQRMDVSAQAQQSYWSYVAVLAKVDMMQSYMAQIDTAYAQTRATVDAGMATRTDLLRVEARRSEVAYQLGQVSNGADLCRLALCDVLGLEADTEIIPADTEAEAMIPADLYDYDLTLRPEYQLMEIDIAAKRQQVNLTRADYLPVLGLQAGWMAYGNIRLNMATMGPDGNYYPLQQKIQSQGWSIMASLQVPLFHWGEGYKKVKSARLDVSNAELTLQENSRKLNLQIRQAIANLQTARAQLQAAELAMTQADASLAATTQSHELGMATITDLLGAQSQWHTSRANLIEARTQLRSSLVDYRRATARL